MTMLVALALAATPSHADDGLSECLGSCEDFTLECMKDAETAAAEDCAGLAGADDWIRRSCEGQAVAPYTGTCAEAAGSCQEACGEAYGSSAGYTLDDCPSGTRPSPLGTCLPDFGAAPEDEDPDDGCPAGFMPGADDGCVPAIVMVPADVVDAGDGSGWVVCPGGTVPGPVDGCVFDTSEVEVELADCPPGFVGGGEGQCVPDHSSPSGRMLLGTMVRTVATLGTELPAELLASWGVVEVEDVERAVAQLEERWAEQVR
jgi:hypothetical protein